MTSGERRRAAGIPCPTLLGRFVAQSAVGQYGGRSSPERHRERRRAGARKTAARTETAARAEKRDSARRFGHRSGQWIFVILSNDAATRDLRSVSRADASPSSPYISPLPRYAVSFQPPLVHISPSRPSCELPQPVLSKTFPADCCRLSELSDNLRISHDSLSIMPAKKRCQLQSEPRCNQAVLRIVGQCPHCRLEFCGTVRTLSPRA